MRTKTKTKKSFAPRTMGLGGAVRRVAMLLVLMFLTTATAWAQNATSADGWEIEKFNDGADCYITDYTGQMDGVTELTIPNTIDGATVRKFKEFSLYNFRDLVTLNFYSDTKIEVMPSVYGCKNFKNVNLLVERDNGYGTLANTLPLSITTIPENAFYVTSLETLRIVGKPDMSIGNYAFSKIDTPCAIYYEGTNDDMIQWNEKMYEGSRKIQIQVYNTQSHETRYEGWYGDPYIDDENRIRWTMGDDARMVITSDNWATFPTQQELGVAYLHPGTTVKSLYIEHVYKIKDSAFENYQLEGIQFFTDLETVEIASGLAEIGNYAFRNLPKLASVTLPLSVASIGQQAFLNCGALKDLYFDGTLAQWNAVTKGSNWKAGVASDYQEHWRCTLTYDANGHGSAPAAERVYTTTALTAPAAPTAQGYTFGGWYKDAACTQPFDFEGGVTDDTTIYAKWTPQQNTVNFDLGGHGTAIDAQTVVSGNVVSVPAMQYYSEGGTDYGIEGWYTDLAFTDPYDFTTAVDHSFTLYAKWAELTGTYTLTANEGGTVTLTDETGRTQQNGKMMPGVYTLTVTPSEGYSFTGSYTLTERTSGASTPATSISGSTALSYTLDLTEKDVAVSVTFSTQPILTVTTRADDESVLSQVTWSVVNNQTTDTSYGNGDAIPFISDAQAVAESFGIRLSVDLGGSLIGYAFTATVTDRGNGSTKKLNSLQGTSFKIQPYGSIDIDLYVYASPGITLQDAAYNSEQIMANEGIAAGRIVLQGRTLYKDGAWNTLCLPFDVGNFTGTPLEGATVKSLKSSGTGFNEETGVLTLNFTDATSIAAGRPYIVKWTTTGQEISNPVFDDVTISRIKPQTVTSNDKKVSFMGTYDYIAFDTDDRSILYMGTENTLYWPKSGASIGAFRAYFQLTDPNVNASAIVLNFGDGETTGIGSIDNGELRIDNDDWYSLDGRRLSGKPTAHGIYIHNGKKVAIK